jgi:hypothetical protein
MPSQGLPGSAFVLPLRVARFGAPHSRVVGLSSWVIEDTPSSTSNRGSGNARPLAPVWKVVMEPGTAQPG